MKIPNSNIKFFYSEGKRICSVKLPIFPQYTMYMNLGTDNRPYQNIVEDINLAFEMVLNESKTIITVKGLPVVKDLSFDYKMRKLLGYGLSNADLK